MKMMSVGVLGKDTESMATMARNWGREWRGELEKLVVGHCILIVVLVS